MSDKLHSYTRGSRAYATFFYHSIWSLSSRVVVLLLGIAMQVRNQQWGDVHIAEMTLIFSTLGDTKWIIRIWKWQTTVNFRTTSYRRHSVLLKKINKYTPFAPPPLPIDGFMCNGIVGMLLGAVCMYRHYHRCV